MVNAEGASNQHTYVFLSIDSSRFSRSSNFFHGLVKWGDNAHWVEINPKRKIREVRKVVNRFNSLNTSFIVASPSHILVPYLRVFTRHKVVLDAGWPLYDGVIQSRRRYGLFGWRLFYIFLLDFISFHLSWKVFLETPAQVSSCQRRYLLNPSKMTCLATGFDENRYIKSNLQNRRKGRPDEFLVLFRGGPQDEAGLNVLFDAIRRVRDKKRVRFVVVSQVEKNEFQSGDNLEIIDGFQDDSFLWELFRNAKIVLGQLSNHPRLEKTLPHKFFEAGFFGKTYLTSDRGEVARYVSDGHVVGFKPGDSRDLASKIDGLLESKSRLDFYGKSFSDLYRATFSQEILTEKFRSELISGCESDAI